MHVSIIMYDRPVRWWVALALLGACNSVFGLHDTQLPPPDAPPSCPMTGVPRFSRNVHQAYLQSCADYTDSADGSIAVAACDYGGGPVISESVSGAPFVAATLDSAGGLQFEIPRLSGDGMLYVRSTDPNGDRYVRYHRAGGTWTFDATLTLPAGINFVTGWITAATQTSPRYMFAVAANGFSQKAYDLVEGPPDTWQVAHTYDPIALGFMQTTDPGDLSNDGLRLVLPAFTNAANRPLYFVRPSIDALFTQGTPLDGVPPINDPFLSNDCGRLYFSAIDSVFYVQQQ